MRLTMSLPTRQRTCSLRRRSGAVAAQPLCAAAIRLILLSDATLGGRSRAQQVRDRVRRVSPLVVPGLCGPLERSLECIADAQCSASGGSLQLAASPGMVCGAGWLDAVTCNGDNDVACAGDEGLTLCGSDAGDASESAGDTCGDEGAHACTGAGA
ncbi:MAG: hypothetical protein ACJAYU_001720 [Bradymonadia bacterium]|jgi:hypothetical protein